MKMFIATRPAKVDGHLIKVVLDFTPLGTPENTEVKNIHEARSFINSYIARNVKEGHKALIVRKEGRAFPGFDAFYKSLPLAVDATTRL
ncbi:hypothetical protein U1K26_000909 [Salmonella enterica]|nr:hypothetical protein [Salmonella enterica]EMA0079646.1 hypothetical protein [Salmonella enterica]EMA5860769.1 hypothetical protein [Salmonella enterica]MLP08428.1 hypothetical protein [Salmonella enterica subsp. enterica serovar Kedougou]HAK2952928.1 hypothetical protein [Salmonella enterica]